ncbi:MAG TPA: LysE family transporter [Coriobacteriia bacterium]|nr:LysE family transporter [Coriobacteriia bacterium]
MGISETAALLARTFVIGLLVAMPVGAMGILCIERTLHRGWRAGLATGAGIATADATYAAVAAFGVTGVSALLTSWQTPLRIVGGVALIVLGVRAALAAPRSASEDAEAEAAAPGIPDVAGVALYTSAVGLTLTNPMTIMAFAAVFAGAGLAGLTSAASALTATAGVAAGSLAWWVALTSGVALVRHGVSPTAARNLSRVSGAAIAVFGVIAIVSVIR